MSAGKDLPSLDQINVLVGQIVSKFKDNLRSVLLYGSAARGAGKTNDLDMVMVLKTKNSSLKDLQIIKEILHDGENNVDLQLLYQKELTNGNTFSLDTHGAFVIEELKNAIPLYGDNPFRLLYPSSQMYQLSVVQKLQYYVFRARQACMGYNFSTKDQSEDFHRKKIRMAMLDLLIAKNISVEKSDTIFEVFIKHYPGIITKTFHTLFTRKTPLEINEALPLYEALYDEALSWTNRIYLEERKPGIAKEEGIFLEYLLPSGSQPSSFAILCDGLPSRPYQNQLMNILAGLGYGVMYPRYRGTWESEGTFLETKPSEDISYLAKRLREGMDFGGLTIKASHISLLATSFGASVALSTSHDANIDQIIALSPVLNFESFSHLSSLKTFLRKMYLSVYRFDDFGWNELAKGNAVPSALSVNKFFAAKIFLFGGREDKEIISRDLEAWGNNFGIPTIIYPEMGHLSFSMLKGKLLDEVIRVLNSSSSKFLQLDRM
jgi:predicted nucleotidyltransferase